jgi:glycosyltransferase involved in cell wall biosynthesis
MRVAHLTATFPPYWGGTGTVAFNHGAGLAALGHDVHVFTGTAGGAEDDPPGVTVHRMKPVISIGNAPLLPKLARLDGFDVVHFHHPFIFGTEAVLAGRVRRKRPALVATYHNRLIGERGRAPIFWLYEETAVRTVMRVADRVCVVSMDHADSVDHLRAGRRRHPERFVEVPNGVDTDAFRPAPVDAALRAEHGIPADATVALFAAALDRAHHFKRLDLVIEAVARADAPDLHLLVIGGGELLEDYRAQAQQAGIGERVHFAGAQPHGRLPDLMRAGDFLVLATEPPESFGLVLIEAMAAGLPVIASDIPGVRTIVRNGHNGFLVPKDDVAGLVRSFERMVELGPSGREVLGSGGRADAEQIYAWPRVVEKLEGVYADALSNHSG